MFGQRKMSVNEFGYVHVLKLDAFLAGLTVWTQCFIVDVMWDWIDDIYVVVQMTVDEAREVCAHSWMKEALDAFVCQLSPQQRVEEASCRLELCRTEELRLSVGAQSGSDEDVDCFFCLVDGEVV